MSNTICQMNIVQPAGTDEQLRLLGRNMDWASQHSYRYHQLYAGRTVLSWPQWYQLPLINHYDVMENALGWAAADLSQSLLTVKTSDGQRWFDTPSLQQESDWWASRLTMVENGQPVLLAMPCMKNSYAAVIDAAIRQRQGIPLPFGRISSFSHFSQVLTDRQVETIIGQPEDIMALGEYCRYHKTANRVRYVILMADYFNESVSRRIEACFDCRLYYALTINDGLFTIAFGPQDGPLRVSSLWLAETVTPDGSLTLPRGQYGQLVVTAVNELMRPLIRYQTSRFTRLLPAETGQIIDRQIKPFPFESLGENDISRAVYAIEQVYDYQAVKSDSHWYFTLYTLYEAGLDTARTASLLKAGLGLYKADVRFICRQDITDTMPTLKVVYR